jgi:di/tricarboxylate transporter
MHWEACATLATLVLVLTALARNWAGPDIVFGGALAILMLLGFVPGSNLPAPDEYARLFGNEGLLTVGVLFIVAAGLTETGGLSLLTERLLGRPKGLRRAQVRMMIPVTIASSVMNNTPVVAMFIPVVQDWCKRAQLSVSKFFIPLSYAALLGGCCTLIGTSTNLVVQGMLLKQHLEPFKMFTLGAVGLPAAIVGIAFLVISSKWLLPDRKPVFATADDAKRYTVEMMVQPHSAIDGHTIEQAGLRHLPGVFLADIERDGERLVAVGPQEKLRGNDRLIFVGVIESVVDLQRLRGLLPATNEVFKLQDPRPDRILVEAVISNTNPLIGTSIREGQFRSRYEAVVIAASRNGQQIQGKIGDIVVEIGDTLLLEAHPRFVQRQRNRRDFFLVSGVENSQPRRYERAWMALAILLLMVLAMAMESVLHVSIFAIATIAAGAMVLMRCCSGEQARRSIDWSTLVAIGAAFGVGRAMETSGAAKILADGLLGMFRGLGPWGVLAGIYLITLIFTEVVTNNAAAVLAFPIAFAAAQGLHVDFMPFAVAIALAASLGFALPSGYAAHLMVHGPGGYRFSDWLRIGIPMDLLMMAVCVTLTPMIFPF